MTAREVPLPPELVGTSWDTPAGRAHYARITKELPTDPKDSVHLYAVARTLRWCAVVMAEGQVDQALEDWLEHWREVATLIETQGMGALEMCCPLCQEVVCDDDCPLAEVRP